MEDNEVKIEKIISEFMYYQCHVLQHYAEETVETESYSNDYGVDEDFVFEVYEPN